MSGLRRGPASFPTRPVRLDGLHAARQQLLRQLQGPLGHHRHRHLAGWAGEQASGEALFEDREGFGGGGRGGEIWPEIGQTLPIAPPAAGYGPRNGRKPPVVSLWTPDMLSVFEGRCDACDACLSIDRTRADA